MEQVLEFFFFVIVVALVVVAAVVYRIYRRIRKNVRDFAQQSGFAQGSGSQDFASGFSSQGSRSEDSFSSTTTEDGDTIIDTRRPQDVNKKIFAKDEGEYVDFKEQ